jgi:hypothetical protein
MRGWTWQFGTLIIGVGISIWLAYSNIQAALLSGANDTLVYSIIADAVLFFFGLAFWHYHSLGRNIACVVLGAFWFMAAAYICASNIVKLQGEFSASWQPVEDAKARHAEAVARLDARIYDAREHLKNAEITALSGKTSIIREAADRQAREERANIALLEEKRGAPAPKFDHPTVKHFAMGLEHIMPILALLAAQVALWATFNSESLASDRRPSTVLTVPVTPITVTSAPVTEIVTAAVMQHPVNVIERSHPLVDLEPKAVDSKCENTCDDVTAVPPVTAVTAPVMDAVTLSPAVKDGSHGEKIVPFTRTSETPVTDMRRRGVPWSKIAAHLNVSEATARRRYAAEAVKQSGDDGGASVVKRGKKGATA